MGIETNQNIGIFWEVLLLRRRRRTEEVTKRKLTIQENKNTLPTTLILLSTSVE
jgi:hypothetical protein